MYLAPYGMGYYEHFVGSLFYNRYDVDKIPKELDPTILNHIP